MPGSKPASTRPSARSLPTTRSGPMPPPRRIFPSVVASMTSMTAEADCTAKVTVAVPRTPKPCAGWQLGDTACKTVTNLPAFT